MSSIDRFEDKTVTVRRKAQWAVVASGLLLAAGASAQAGSDEPPGRNAGNRGAQRMMHAEQRAQRAEPLGARDSAPRPSDWNRLSPEERRQLRRDVDDAGRDIYPPRMPPGRHRPRSD